MSRKGYLFDFDGTLVDTMEGFADIAGEVMNRNFPEMSFDEARRRYLETSGVPFHQQLEIIFPNASENVAMASEFEDRKKEGFFRAKFENDVKIGIDGLRKRGDLAGISSNNFQDLIEQFVKKEDLSFDIIMGYVNEEFQKGKDHFDYFLEKYKMDRSDLTFVGDSMKDAEKALNNNLKFIGVTGFFKKEDFQKVIKDAKVVDSVKEILDI